MLGEKTQDIACIPRVQYPSLFHSLSINSRGMSIVCDVGYCVCLRGGEVSMLTWILSRSYSTVMCVYIDYMCNMLS